MMMLIVTSMCMALLNLMIYELYYDFYGPDEYRVYCISRSEAGVTPYWTGVEKCDDYEGKVVLPRTGSDEPVDSFVRTTGSNEPVDSVVSTTGSDEPFASVVHTTGSNEPVDSVVCIPGPAEPVNDVTPCWAGDEEDDNYGGNVVLTWTGSDEPIDSVVHITVYDEPVDSFAAHLRQTLLALSPPMWRFRRSVMSRVVRCVIMMTIVMMDIMMKTRTILTMMIRGILTITPMCMAL